MVNPFSSLDSLTRERIRSILPPVIAGGFTILFARLVFFVPFFLVPMGFFVRSGQKTTRQIVIATSLGILGNALVGLISGSLTEMTSGLYYGIVADTVYFSILILVFIWAINPAPIVFKGIRIRTAYRLAIASLVASLALLPLVWIARRDEGLVAFITSQAEALVTAAKDAAGADVVQRSLLERDFSADTLTSLMGMALSRGASLGHMVFLTLSVRIADTILAFRERARFAKALTTGTAELHDMRRLSPPSLSGFRNTPYLVWVLIGTLCSVLGSIVLKMEYMEIVSWNLLSVCAFLYLAQGLAIVSFNLARPGVPRMMRPLAAFMTVLLLFRPGINAALIVVLAIIGVAENWLPLRVAGKTEPPPTPGA